MGWNIVDDSSKPASKAQRRLLHIGASELSRHPDYVKLLTQAEADQVIAIFLRLRDRYTEKNSERSGVGSTEPQPI